ncbi:hypothetical protein VU07_01020 [Desulfobulbus sp. F4]|nr:hypothetical protein [Desulfobulbus sp. F3]MCW5200388.1 hypothetical protein [Desulfobulbus sp. F4]
MKTKYVVAIAFLFIAVGESDISLSEIKGVAIPDVEVGLGLNSVLNQKNRMIPTANKQSSASPSAGSQSSVATNGYVLSGNSTVIVDNPIEPKCVFYGNYNEGSGDSFQYLDVNTIIFECQ